MVYVKTRKDYKNEFIAWLDSEGLTYDDKIIKSVLGKVARNARNKYGTSNWEDEYDESDISAAKMFYREYGKQDTYNRQNARGWRR